MNRNTIRNKLAGLDEILVCLGREGVIGAVQRGEEIGKARVLRREIEDNLNARVNGLEVFGRGGAKFEIHGAEILAVAERTFGEYVVLVDWRDSVGSPHRFVTAVVRIWDETGRTVEEWDYGHYFCGGDLVTDLKAAKRSFAERAGLV